MCDIVAVGGNVGKSRWPSCFDVIILPSGIVTRVGMVDLVMLIRLLFGVDRWVVHPVSRIVGLSCWMGGSKFDVVLKAFVIFVTSLLLVFGSPRRQRVVSFVVFFLFFPILNSQHPSIISIHVASFWCNSLGFLHCIVLLSCRDWV